MPTVAEVARARVAEDTKGGAEHPSVDILASPATISSVRPTHFPWEDGRRTLPAPVLVTGAAGFIGFHLIRRLNEQYGVPVVGLDNVNDYYEVSLKESRLETLFSANTTQFLPDGITAAAPTRSASSSFAALPNTNTSTWKGVESFVDSTGLTRQYAPATNPLFHFIHGDLANGDVVERVFGGEAFSLIVHLGAQAGVRYSITNPGAYIQSNLVGFANILESTRKHLHPSLLTKEEAASEKYQESSGAAVVPAARSVQHLVYASSSSVYGGNVKNPFSEKDCVDHPVSLYAATKKSNELTAHAYSSLYRIPTTGLRFFTVYGPYGRPDMAPAIFTKNVLAGKEISLFNYGEMRRDFTYVLDIVEGIVQVMLRPPTAVDEEGAAVTRRVGDKHGRDESMGVPEWDPMDPTPAISAPSVPFRVFNIGNSSPVPLQEFVRTLGAVLDREVKSVLVPMQKGDVVSTAADTRFLEHVTGFKPSTSLAEGLKAYGTWYKAYYQVE